MISREDDRCSEGRDIFLSAHVSSPQQPKDGRLQMLSDKIEGRAIDGIHVAKFHERFTRTESSNVQNVGKEVATQSISSIVVCPSAVKPATANDIANR